MKFLNRSEAGKLLAEKLINYAAQPDTLVLGLPRGGVPVAYEIAVKLHVPLDVFIVRKLGVPEQEELAFGAIASSDITVFNQEIIDLLQISSATIDRVIHQQKKEIARRSARYRGEKTPLQLAAQTIILVDDGIATGATVAAAIVALKQQNPAQIILAVPVAPRAVCQQLASQVTHLICLRQEDYFGAVGYFYEDFSQTTDEEVIELLAKRMK